MSSTAFKTLILPAFVTLIAFFFAWQFVDPAPPKEIVLTTGQQDGAYYAYAQKYQQILQRHGISVILRVSQGSVENIDNLLENRAQVGFVQGGTASLEVKSAEEPKLQTLGSLYYEPLWVFHRQGDTFDTLSDVAGKRLAVGAEGSGTRALVMRILSENNFLDRVELTNGPADDPLEALKAGSVDIVFLVASPNSDKVLRMLEDESIALLSFERADAYERRMKFLSHVTLPRGMVDLSRDLPRKDKKLLASAANLVVRDDLHPAIQDLLLQAAEEVHGGGGWFEGANEFPNAQFAEFPVSKEAKRFYKFGPPFLQRFLPFRLASLIDRLKVMILPLVVLMIPLMKVMPPIYTWRMRSKIYRWYQSLEQIDLAYANPDPDMDALRAKLEEIDQEVIHVQVPLSFASQLYDLRQHIELVKRRLG